MIILYILAAIALLIAAVLLLNVHLILAYDTRPKIKARVLFVTLDILKIVENSGKKPKKKKAQPPTDKPQQTEKKKPRGSFEDFVAFVELIISLVKMFTHNLSRSLAIHLRRLNVVVGSDSADKTALRYTKLCNTVAILLELLPETVRKFKKDYKEINIYPDYTAEKCTFAAEVVFTMKVWHLLRILFGAVGIFTANTRKRISERNRTKA